ncbi:MAG: NTP transferase domain-containing protein [Candidatus Bathyarchaeota archaeon]|nr:NTP transferase domain-containing protein [Candidatus Bathyarchaeota archaeon]
MKVTALVMAGGKGKRMMLNEEKPLLQVGGKAVIEHVLVALQNATKIQDIVVTITDHTPKTAAFLSRFPVQVIKTPGREYVSDMGFAVKALKLNTVLTIAADLPLITSSIIDDIVDEYARCGKTALAVAVPFELREKLGLGAGYTFNWHNRRLVYAGINVNDGRRITDAELEQEIYVLDKIEVALNINTVEELHIAQKQFSKNRT